MISTLLGQISAEKGAELWEAHRVHAHDGLWEVILISAGPAIDKVDPLLSCLPGHHCGGYNSDGTLERAMVVRASIRLWGKEKRLVPAKAQLKTLLKFMKHQLVELVLILRP